jgi:ataxin-3
MSADLPIYHERQEAACCGRHAINALMQGPVFDDVSLADAAIALWASERALLEGPPSPGGENPYVDNSGNFSVEVLSNALRGRGVELLRDAAEVTRSIDNPALHPAYLFNRNEHWFLVRRFEGLGGGKWLNLDSVNPSPMPIGDFYVRAPPAPRRPGAPPRALCSARARAAALHRRPPPTRRRRAS